MERLTTNKEVSEMNMVELAHNSCFAKDRNATYRDFETEIDARDFIRKIGLTFGIFENDCEEMTDDEVFDEVIADSLQYGYEDKEGLLALLYRNLWAQANLYERLKHYEDLEEQGLLLKLPVTIGDTVYTTDGSSLTVREIHIQDNLAKYFVARFNPNGLDVRFGFDRIGKTVFLTQAEAEEALKNMQKNNNLIKERSREFPGIKDVFTPN